MQPVASPRVLWCPGPPQLLSMQPGQAAVIDAR